MGTSIGIDLGTTNSVLAAAGLKPNGDIVSRVIEIRRPVDMYSGVNGGAKLNNEKKLLLPSYVYYAEEKDYAPVVGDFAKMQYAVRPHLVAKSVKSQMGKPYAEGLSDNIKDKTPAEISARILKHLIKDASAALKEEIKDAVITVPANFDAAMCRATRDAAEIAGINVRYPDGTDKPILLSEPNAVIYDLFNQIRNGEISSSVLDLSGEKTVLVFDLGGGTLDITMHRITRRNSDRTLKVSEIASNRYTRLGGDNFDEAIAEEMFRRYLNQYKAHPDVVNIISQKKSEIMPQLRTFAEHLKIELNESVSSDSDSGWFGEESGFSVGGNIHSTGYAYDDTFSVEELENILSVFMGKELTYSDFRRTDEIKNTDNIIFPVLDVLAKAAARLGTDSPKADAVIVNGGMSKFYMVTDRLTEFFGYSPIVTLNPDLSVARGAAVYNYLLNVENEKIADDMKLFESEKKKNEESRPVSVSFGKSDRHIGIEWGRSILNDSLYLGLRHGAAEVIIPTGAELPYTSEVMEGFIMQPGQKAVSFPVKARRNDGSLRTIATARIEFAVNRETTKHVAFKIHMDTSKMITMTAWTYSKKNACLISYGETSIHIGDTDGHSESDADRMLQPQGSRLDAKAEIDTLIKLYAHGDRSQDAVHTEKLRLYTDNICSASNPEDFAPEILSAFSRETDPDLRARLYLISKRIQHLWKPEEKRKLASVCMAEVSGALYGLSAKGRRKNAVINAVMVLAYCADDRQTEELKKLQKYAEFRNASLVFHAVTGTETEWIADQVTSDLRLAGAKSHCALQDSVRAFGIALNMNQNPGISVREITRTTIKIADAVEGGQLNASQLTACLFALGMICDFRNTEYWNIGEKTVSKVRSILKRIKTIYGEYIYLKNEQTVSLARKMIDGISLNWDEEQYLLEKTAG